MELIPARTIVIKTKRPAAWFGTDFNMNIYRGCSHGCIYCDSRSACYGDTAFDTIKVKKNALEVIRNDLSKARKGGVVATGAMSDSYNPLERELLLTRNALQLIHAYRFGVAIATKSTLITRDADILQDVTRDAPVIVKVTITTADDELSRKIEPGAPSSSERFGVIKALAEQGIYCGVLMMPLLPFINDTRKNVVELVRLAKDAGASFVYPAFGMTLRQGNREYYYEQLDELFPDLRDKYTLRYGTRYNCSSPKAKTLWNAFTKECANLDLPYDMKNITHRYKTPYESQLKLF